MSLLVLFRPGAGQETAVLLPTSSHLYRSARRYYADANLFVTEKDPSDVVDYELDWSRLLGSDTIADSRWGVPAGITGNSGSMTGTTTTIWVSSGAAGTDYGILNRITTSDGRVMDRTLMIPVRAQ